MRATPLPVPRRDPTATEALRHADHDPREHAPLAVSLAECLLARHGDAKPRDTTARLLLMIARAVAG
jgi:hypothetical protein